MNFNKNCCDGIYNSFDVHFTSDCDNECAHCIDKKYNGLGCHKPEIDKIADTIINNQEGYEDVLFLGGEPCLYLQELVDCIKLIQNKTKLKIFVTTSVPKICYDKYDLFLELLELVDGINLSVQDYREDIADAIRRTKSKFDRQDFYRNLPNKDKIRINLNIVKPFLYTKEEIIKCLKHYDDFGFNSIKLSEIQHGIDYYVSFEKVFGIDLGSPYYYGCQKYLDMNKIIDGFKTKLLLKRSCFMCEQTLKASLMDGLKVGYKLLTKRASNKYAVVYGNGEKTNGWR